MNIVYSNNDIDIKDYKEIIKSAGWKELSDNQISKSLIGTSYIACAKHNNKTIGMARLISDNAMHGLLFDVVVLPEYMNLGIGRNLVEMVKNFALGLLKKDEQFLIELLPSAGKRNFYLNCGFKYKPENMDGMYLWLKK